MTKSTLFDFLSPGDKGNSFSSPTLDPAIFKRLADTSTQAIGMATLDSHIVYANETLRHMLGITAGTPLAEHSFYDFYTGQDARRLREEIIPLVQTQGEWTGEIGLRSLTGEQYQTIQNVFLIRDECGAPTAFANVITDLTERARVDASLRIKDAAIASSLNAIAIAGLDGKLSYVNQSFVDLWRLQGPEDAIGRLPLAFWERPEDAQMVIEALYSQGRWQGELRARRHDGSLAELLLSAHLVMDGAGQPVCMMGSFIDITARKQVEAEILATRNQLEATINAVPDLLFELGLNGVYLDIRAAHSDFLVAPADDLLGKSVSDMLPPQAADVVMSALREAQTTGQSHGKQFELQLPQGNSWFELSVSRKHTDPGQMPRFIVLSREITIRKQMGQALQRERDFAASLINTAPVIILLLDTRGYIRHINPYFEQLSGYRLDEVKGKDWFTTFLPARDQDRVRELFQSATHDVPTRGNVNPIVTRNGEEREIEWYDQIMHDAAGTVTGLLVIGLDVTERKRIDAKLRESEAELSRFKNTLDQTLDCVFMFDAEQLRFFYVNQGAINQMGYTQDELLQMHPYDIKPEFSEAQFRNLIAPLLSGAQESLTFETVHQHKNGQQLPVEVFLQYIVSQGQVPRFMAVVRDITQRKAAEEEIKHLAFHDPLTHLPNRRLLRDRMQHALATSARSGRRGALLFIDLDNFKTLNDTLGHDMGDLLLQQVAQRLATCVREGDTVSRLGGDEFVVMLEDLSENAEEAATQTETVGGKVLATLNQPYLLDGHDYHSTPSIGATLFGDHQNSIDELLRRADLAMYQAKAAGCNTLRFFDPDM